MGLGIVLLFWLVVSGIVSAAAAVVLAGIVYFVERRRGRVRKRWLLGFAILPFLATAYLWSAFAVYGVWCETVRDVDLGIGDSWRVPLTDGYRLTMIDTPDQAFVSDPRGHQSHFGLKRIGTTDRYVAGEDERGFFLIDSQRRMDSPAESEAELRTQLSAAGAEGLALLTPGEFYDRHRWGAADAVAAALMVGPPLVGLCILSVLFARSGTPATHR